MKNKAFTLAEVLITLSVLGVIAAITIPNLVNKQKEQATVTKVLKMYSALTNAFNSVYAEHGLVSNWGKGLQDNSPERNLKLLEKLATSRICTKSSEKTCLATNKATSLTGTVDYADWAFGQRPAAILKDGSSIIFHHYSDTCTASTNNLCDVIYYDTNGPEKGPNRKGIDIFEFEMAIDGIDSKSHQSNNYCSLNNTNVHNGRGCTDYIIRNRNMNYLRE